MKRWSIYRDEAMHVISLLCKWCCDRDTVVVIAHSFIGIRNYILVQGTSKYTILPWLSLREQLQNKPFVLSFLTMSNILSPQNTGNFYNSMRLYDQNSQKIFPLPHIIEIVGTEASDVKLVLYCQNNFTMLHS